MKVTVRLSLALLFVAALSALPAGCGQDATAPPPGDPPDPPTEPDYSVAPQPILSWGGFGSGDGQLHQPIGLDLGPDGTVYVCDTQHHQIQKFTPEGEFLGKLGPNVMHFPKTVAVDRFGRVFVGDHTHRIHVFNPNGTYREFLDYHVKETGLIISQDGNLLVAGYKIIQRTPVLKAEGPYVFRVSPGGNEIARWNARVDGRTSAWVPTGIAEDKHGNVYVGGGHFIRNEDNVQTKTGEFVWVFSRDGVIRDRYGIEGEDAEFLGFQGIAVDSRQSVYVADWRAGLVRRFSPKGEHELAWSQSGIQVPLRAPADVLVDGDDRIYVADWGLNVVVKFGYN